MSTKIAVTYEDGQVFQHFGRTQQVKIYEIDNGKIVSTQIVDTSEHGHGAMAGYVKGFGATVIICGGLGDGARNSVRDAGLELVNGVSGDADAAVQAYIDGTLVRSGGDCDHHCHHRLHYNLTVRRGFNNQPQFTSSPLSNSSTSSPHFPAISSLYPDTENRQ
ncbi:MAG: hypothetical protein II933_04740 [Candidatus Methanomethylophilaceae archaeon]|nr:hypothetical protein [Candidatus Methanomethylophilaceae archaeon]